MLQVPVVRHHVVSLSKTHNVPVVQAAISQFGCDQNIVDWAVKTQNQHIKRK